MTGTAFSADSSSSQPLLREDREEAVRDNEDRACEDAQPEAGPLTRRYNYYRQKLQDFLASKAQHYIVLSLVALDLLGIFADIFIALYTCEEGQPNPTWDKVRDGLGIAGLVFSCLFMVELIMSIWAFGWRYFQSTFHIFDALVIVAGFIVDVLLHGVLEEIASLVVVLRLWRFFKIIEEFSVGAEEQMDQLEEKIEALESENEKLKKLLGRGKTADEEQGTQ
ncbi:hypothetical protein B7494_g150 [Chlorociboria aeruginascens]|nr:hypothetical protein B7494_g150 [Chlorociboria aeruginascens]